jgi:protein-S-isoprenylcysteine O-methyltransferase Ste14
MRASQWEFKNRATLFGFIFAFAFSLYLVDPRNTAVVLSEWLSARSGWVPRLLVHLIFAFAALLVMAAAAIRTWASACLHAAVVYGAQVKTESLVADGPYRFVRNPLYLANVLFAVGIGSMMSRSGCIAVVVLTCLFCYRLVLLEETALREKQGMVFEHYRRSAHRFWPSLAPHLAAAGGQANWAAGFKAEMWYWGFAAALTVFAAALNATLCFVMFAASIVAIWSSSGLLQRKPAAAE